jgi:hypothetical protein
MTTDTFLNRTSINLTTPQLTWLQREARRLGITLGELLRRIIDEKRTGR